MNIAELLYSCKRWRSNGKMLPTEDSIGHDRCLVDMSISSSVAPLFGALALSLVAIPTGIRVKRSDTRVNTAIALGFHFSMVILSRFRTWTNLHPGILMWLPNLVLATLGAGRLRGYARLSNGRTRRLYGLLPPHTL
jgi:lipopolysaccharide export LptBFGC system permease protein LptF